MSNVATLYSVTVQRSYERDGFNDAVNALKQVARREVFSDGLLVSRGAGGAKLDVVTNAATKMYLLNCNSPSGATTTAYLQMFNTSSASVTLGTTIPTYSMEISSGETVPVLFPSGRTFAGALSWAVTTTTNGQTAVNATNSPAVTIVYK